MAIAIDASSPAVATQIANTTATITTVSFTPPANSLLVAMGAILYSGTTGTGSPFAMSDSLSGTWTSSAIKVWGSGGNPAAGVFTRLIGSSAAMTVTLTSDTVAKGKQLVVKVLTGAAASAWTGNKVEVQDSTTANFLQQNFTTSTVGSWVFMTCVYDTNATLTANANTTQITQLTDPSANDAGQIPAGNMTTPTVTPGVISLGWTGDASGTAKVYAAAEILPPATALPPRPSRHGATLALTRSYSY